MIQIEVKSENICGDVRFSYCQVEDIPMHFARLKLDGWDNILSTRLVDEFGRPLNEDGQLI